MVELLTAPRPSLPSAVLLVRELNRTYQTVSAFEAACLKGFGLTQSQADVLFALGNAGPLSCKDLGERAVISKGTLTGVLDRLERKRLIRRRPSKDDRRVMNVSLSLDGETLFRQAYTAYVEALSDRAHFAPSEDRQILRSLACLRATFD